MTSDMIRRIRTRYDVSLDQFGAMLGVTGRTVWNWESGRTVPSRYYRAILEHIMVDAGPIMMNASPFSTANFMRHTCPQPYTATYIAGLGYETEGNNL